jgi:glycosyltransferase involved in cell wall biosynthesis
MIWNTGSISALAGKLFGKISVTQVHGGDIDFAYKPYQLLLSRLSYRWNRIVLATNRDFIDDLKKLGNERKVYLLPNIISEHRAGTAKEDLKRELGLGNQFNILCIGRLVTDNNMETKGIRYVIMAVQKLSDVCLHILGDGPLKKDYQELSETLGIKDRVLFHGKVPRDTLFQFMSAADAVVLPSLREGLSMTMLEALSTGIPFIGTPIGGARDYIVDGENGFFIKMKDVDSIVDVIARLQNESGLMAKIVRNGYETYKEYFTGDAVVKKFEEIVQAETDQ